MHAIAALTFAASLVLAQSNVPPTPAKGTTLENMPVLGFGTWHIHDNGSNATEVVATAIENGYRHIDCAYAYLNQRDVGIGIKEGLRRTGLERSDLWITSKIWNNRHGNEEFAITQTLDQLGLDYLDLYLVHWPLGNSTGNMTFDFLPTWQAMEKLVRPTRGTRYLGLSNFSPSQLDEVLKIAKIKPLTHQIELHPFLQQSDYVARHMKEGITLTAYSPLGNTNPFYAEFGARAPPMLQNKVLNEVAKTRGCTPAQVSLAWNIKRGVVVIPKAVKTEHQKENIAAYEHCKLQDEDMEKLKDVGVVARININTCKVLDYRCFEGLQNPGP